MTKEQWQAIKFHNKEFDGSFVYTMKKSKRVCNPSCTDRSGMLPGNVIIFNSLEDALKKGYHPCNKCRPDKKDFKGPKEELVKNARRIIDKHYMEKISLDWLAGEMYINKCYLLRVFKELTGQTILEYQNGLRCEAAKKMLVEDGFSAAHISELLGFSSASHFSQFFKKNVGLKPMEYKNNYYNSLDED